MIGNSSRYNREFVPPFKRDREAVTTNDDDEIEQLKRWRKIFSKNREERAIENLERYVYYVYHPAGSCDNRMRTKDK